MKFTTKLFHLLGLKGKHDLGQTIRFVTFVTTLRIGYLFYFPLSLVGDESYYWEWGRQLDWGYYSKPPMIGWLMGAVHFLGADTAPLVRLPASLLGGGILLFTYLLGRSMFSPKVGFFAMVFLCLSPSHSVLSLVFTIDAPLLFFWSLSLLAFWKIFFENRGRRWILLLIVSLGLGNLTKQMTLIFPLLGTIVLLIDPGKRHFLRLPTFWLGWLCTLLFLAPTLWWNQQHDWITVSHTASHLRSSSPDIGKRLSFFFEFLLAEAFIIGPVLFFASILYFLRNCSEMWKHSGKRFLLLFSFPAIALFLILSLNQRVNPNWPAVFYLPFFLLTTSHFLGDEKPFRHIAWRRFKIGNLVSCGFLNLTLYSMPFLLNALSLEGTKFDLFKRMRGYNQYAQEVMQIKEKLPNSDDIDLLVIGHRYDLCQLAFHAQGQPRVHSFPKDNLISSQYDIWSSTYSLGQRNALLIYNISHLFPVDLDQHFADVINLPEQIRIPFASGKQLFFDLYYAKAKIQGESSFDNP